MDSRTPHAVPVPASGRSPFRLFARAFDSMRERRALRAARRSADAELLSMPVPSLRLAWRAAELVVPKRRMQLARSLRGLVRDADSRYLPNAAPINRRAVRAVSGDLLAVAHRLADLENPIAPRGVLLVERLLLDSDGPMYDRERARELFAAVDEAAAALELP
jgi:hypothetical protein